MVSGSCKQSPQAPINLLFSLLSGMDKKRHLHLQIIMLGKLSGVMFFADMQLVGFGGSGERSQFSVKKTNCRSLEREKIQVFVHGLLVSMSVHVLLVSMSLSTFCLLVVTFEATPRKRAHCFVLSK